MKIKYALVIAGILGIAYFSSARATWDTSTPSGTEAKSLGDDRIREFKTDVQTALNAYGVFPGTDTANPKYVWTISSGTTAGRPYVGISTGTLYVNVSSGCIERYLGVQGWTCVQTVNPNFELNTSTLTITTNNETVYDYVTGGVANILNIRNTAADTSTATASLRFWVGNANEARIVAVRNVAASDALDLAINMRGGGTRYQPVLYKYDGTVLHKSSDVHTGTNLFNSSATFNAKVTFSSTTVFSSIPAFLIQNLVTDSNVTGNTVNYGVLFDAEIYDVGNNVSNSTFTAPTTALYYLTACVTLTDATATAHNKGTITLKTSNRNYTSTIWDANPAPSDDITGCISVLADMDAGDIASVDVVASASSQDVDVAGPNTPPAGASPSYGTHFSGFQVR